jgi:membrane associated rhomboid family serine protease/Zn-finger nucleic acid-binding protein
MTEECSELSRHLPCAKCRETLSTIKNFDGVVVDRCPKCYGTWYDAGELEQVLGDAFNYQALMRIVSTRLSECLCPCCRIAMRSLVFSFHGGELVIDHCPSCRGFWLDSGELDSVKNLVEAIKEGVAPVRIGFSSARPISHLAGTYSFNNQPLLKDSALAHYRSIDYETGSEISQIGISSYLFSALTALPIEVFNPLRSPAHGIYLLIIINVAIFVYSGSLEAGDFLPFMREYGMIPVEVLGGKLHSLLTSLFVHASFWHLFANMYVLYVFGDNVYDLFKDNGNEKGQQYFMFFYLIVGVFSSLVHIAFTSSDPLMSTIPVVGASGCVSGVMAAYWRAFPKTKVYQIVFWYPFKFPIWLYLGFWLFFNLMLGLVAGAGARVSWQAHLGGFFAGYYLLPHFLPFRLERLQPEKTR